MLFLPCPFRLQTLFLLESIVILSILPVPEINFHGKKTKTINQVSWHFEENTFQQLVFILNQQGHSIKFLINMYMQKVTKNYPAYAIYLDNSIAGLFAKYSDQHVYFQFKTKKVFFTLNLCNSLQIYF